MHQCLISFSKCQDKCNSVLSFCQSIFIHSVMFTPNTYIHTYSTSTDTHVTLNVCIHSWQLHHDKLKKENEETQVELMQMTLVQRIQHSEPGANEEEGMNVRIICHKEIIHYI